MWNSFRGSGILGVVVVVLCGEAFAVGNPASGGSNTGLNPPGQVLVAAPPSGTVQDRTNWVVTCDSAQAGYECAKAIDGTSDTFWYTQDSPNAAPLPHTMTIDMQATRNVNGVAVLPRQDGNQDGFIARHQIFLSTDGINFGSPVAFGTWYADSSQKFASFEAKRAKFVRIVALTEAAGSPRTSIGEVIVYVTSRITSSSPELGAWGPTIVWPVVPVAVSLQPDGKVLAWSSYTPDAFIGSPGGFTLTATYDPATGIVSQRNVTNTQHDMFCPGISIDANGRTIVTGGNDAAKTSIYQPGSDSWIPGPNMVISRGYQSSATCSDGRVFVIGGSWNGGKGNKNGEICDPSTNTWTSLPQCPVAPMLTDDKAGNFRTDNHAMLFAWKGNTVFQAGPSKAMNWYTTTGTGGQKGAGLRGDDGDAMCGTAVMFDEGKVLTAGGSPDYSDSPSTTNSYVISIDAPNTTPTVEKTGNMTYNRIFHNAVVLPNGETFITGGQQVGEPFFDTTPQLTPEMYSPTTDGFRPLASNSVPRVYHSFAILLPDGTVLSGGGGLCGTCNTNHFDAQIYSPPYLFTSSGARATRPIITSTSTVTVQVRDQVIIKTDRSVSTASIIRFGSSTHTVNTDQRRVALALTALGTNSYQVTMPADYGCLIPGYWMMFVMDSNGVPSVAKTIKVTLP